MTFPAGIVRVFSGTPPPPVLSFRLVHTAPVEHFQPNADLIFRCLARAMRGPDARGARGRKRLQRLRLVAAWHGAGGVPSLDLPLPPTAAQAEWEGIS